MAKRVTYLQERMRGGWERVQRMVNKEMVDWVLLVSARVSERKMRKL